MTNFASYGSDDYDLSRRLRNYQFCNASYSNYPHLCLLIDNDISTYKTKYNVHLNLDKICVVKDPVINFSVIDSGINHLTTLFITSGALKKLSYRALNAGISHELYHVITFQNSKTNVYHNVARGVTFMSILGLAMCPTLALGAGVLGASLSGIADSSLALGCSFGSSSFISHIIESHNELRADQFSCKNTSRSALLELLYSIKRDYQKYGSMNRFERFWDAHKSIQKRIDYFSNCNSSHNCGCQLASD